VNGLLEDSESCGFCIFNNVAAGAMHALSERHQVRCERVAIVDIDVHHGNGTEEIVRRAHDPSRLFFFSVHLYDNPNNTPTKNTKGQAKEASQWSFYPGTGDRDDMVSNVVNVPIAPLWREKEVATANITANSSIAAASTTNVTRARTRREAAAAATAKKEEKKPADDAESVTSESSKESRLSRKSSTNKNSAADAPSYYLLGTGERAYRLAIRTRLLPALRAFNPDLILISAGFDACRGDVGNAKHMAGGKERPGIDLDPEDYAWTTRRVSLLQQL
jgi:acetoin utilization deacetylase AcuC-like enzyme